MKQLSTQGFCTENSILGSIVGFGILTSMRQAAYSSLFSTLLALTLCMTILTGAALHSMIHHDHHEGNALWDDMHSALRHEDKKVFILTLSAVLTIVTLFLAYFAVVLCGKGTTTKQITISNRLLFELRRGILPYRKFR